jgi:hypothetical protein
MLPRKHTLLPDGTVWCLRACYGPTHPHVLQGTRQPGHDA